jgi:hypothetical protein
MGVLGISTSGYVEVSVVTGRLQHTGERVQKSDRGVVLWTARWRRERAYEGAMGDVLRVRSAHE